jgi:hypothetical protein
MKGGTFNNRITKNILAMRPSVEIVEGLHRKKGGVNAKKDRVKQDFM